MSGRELTRRAVRIGDAARRHADGARGLEEEKKNHAGEFVPVDSFMLFS